jgi:hypothetical protein
MSDKRANKMNQIRGIVIATLLTVWCFPAVSSARTPPTPAPQIEQIAATTNGRPAGPAADAETSSLAAREAQARELQGFRGGSGVYIYVGSGALVVVLVVLLILIIV